MTKKLEIKKAVFYTSMKAAKDYPGDKYQEVIFAGKSNAGKSSLINYLANNSKLAYVSKQPGKTRLINFFIINESFCLVDLPGYGYARVSHDERKSWGGMVEEYFDTTKKLKAVFLLADIRHKPSADDLQMIEWAIYYNVPFVVVATKADKIAKSKRFHAAKIMKNHIAEALQIVADFPVVPVSSLEKKGKEDILSYMSKFIAEEEE